MIFQVSSKLQNVYARQCVGASVGLDTRHNLCRTDHIEGEGIIHVPFIEGGELVSLLIFLLWST